MKSLSLFAFLCAISVHSVASTSTAYPSIPGVDPGDCSLAGGDTVFVPPRREVYDDGRIFDITHRYVPEMPVWNSKEGLGHFLWLAKSMKNGSRANNSVMKLDVHTGTHVDAPGHFYDNYFDAGFDVDSLDLRVLNGLALLVDVPRDKNITAEVMKSLNIPRGVSRVLFRTLNTDRLLKNGEGFGKCRVQPLWYVWTEENGRNGREGNVLNEKNLNKKVYRRLMFKKEFDTSYVGFKEDGAKWLVENTDIKLVAHGTSIFKYAIYLCIAFNA
ncbi:hypothetical protein SESBI_31938 [Sesbania bispinosa]|nr:hypothetical protein SESBI_31938 [Sesbania bispinosa]